MRQLAVHLQPLRLQHLGSLTHLVLGQWYNDSSALRQQCLVLGTRINQWPRRRLKLPEAPLYTLYLIAVAPCPVAVPPGPKGAKGKKSANGHALWC